MQVNRKGQLLEANFEKLTAGPEGECGGNFWEISGKGYILEILKLVSITNNANIKNFVKYISCIHIMAINGSEMIWLQEAEYTNIPFFA